MARSLLFSYFTASQTTPDRPWSDLPVLPDTGTYTVHVLSVSNHDQYH